MKTITFKPHPDIETLDSEFVAKWSNALRKSKQHKFGFVSHDLQSQCCLAVGAEIEGAQMSLLYAEGNGDWDMDDAKAFSACKNTLRASRKRLATDDDGYSYVAARLNDKCLTHPQIADLLDGKTVTIEVPE